jgi:hypothetical protein
MADTSDGGVRGGESDSTSLDLDDMPASPVRANDSGQFAKGAGPKDARKKTPAGRLRRKRIPPRTLQVSNLRIPCLVNGVTPVDETGLADPSGDAGKAQPDKKIFDYRGG